jgi:hypothetical protein
MAVPASFNESNMLLDSPPGFSPDGCEPLCVHFSNKGSSGYPEVLSCWKLTQDELNEINKTGRIWVTVIGCRVPPISVSGLAPFIQTPPEGT